MKINIYDEDDIAKLREGGAILARVLGELVAMAKPGVTTAELDSHAEKRLREAGGEPSFKGYKAGGSVPFPGTVCTSIGDEVVHGPPVPSRTVVGGQLLKLDIGYRYKGFCTDMAVTVPVGGVSKEDLKLAWTTREALYAALETVRPGASIGDIGKAVQPLVEKAGFGVVRDLTGHGTGRGIHEDPHIPNFRDSSLPKIPICKGMVLAIEPMVNAGTWRVEVADDDWTIVTADRRPSAHFEVSVAVTDDGCEILTPLPDVPL